MEIKDEEIYFVATNDYLYHGGDEMYFFEHAEKAHELNYKIRNAMIDSSTYLCMSVQFMPNMSSDNDIENRNPEE